jgi:hypothetical protein
MSLVFFINQREFIHSLMAVGVSATANAILRDKGRRMELLPRVTLLRRAVKACLTGKCLMLPYLPFIELFFILYVLSYR